MTEQTAEYVRVQSLELVFRQSLSGIFANLAVALLLAGLLVGEVAPGALGTWVVVMVTVAGARLAWQRVHQARLSDPESLRHWYRWYLVLMAVLGITWGLGGAVFFHQADSVHQFILFLVLGGLAVAGVSEDGLVEMVELSDHPWHVACQFHPEFTSSPRDGHPLFRGFIEAARRRIEVETEPAEAVTANASS